MAEFTLALKRGQGDRYAYFCDTQYGKTWLLMCITALQPGQRLRFYRGEALSVYLMTALLFLSALCSGASVLSSKTAFMLVVQRAGPL